MVPALIEHFLLEGPQPRRREFWMVVCIVCEFLTAFRALHFVGPCVTVFGSARFKEGHVYSGQSWWCGALRAAYRHPMRILQLTSASACV
jgi:hypothetical protein